MNSGKIINRRQFIGTMAAAGMTLPVSNFYANNIIVNQNSNHPVCIFSKHLQFLPDYKTMAEVAAEIGFDGVDLTVRPGGHLLPENVQSDLPKALIAVKNAGLQLPMMVTNISDPDDPLTEPVLKSAGNLGIKYYRMGYIKLDKSLSVIQTLDKIKSYFDKLVKLNEKYNIIGMYQNHSGNRFGGPVWDIWEILRDYDPKWIGCQYDIRHATVEGAYSWPQGMELMAPFTKTTAIKDFYWKKDKDSWKIENCPLGAGMVDFNSYFDLYKKLNFSGPITMHFEYKHYEKSDPLSVQRKSTVEVMKKDLTTLRKMLRKYGIDS